MRIFSYIVARDYGFAPNPFFGVCTLATCKPVIRGAASAGDWVIGTGSKRRKREGHLVYAMLASETMTFNEYWQSERFQQKKPNLAASTKQAFGDNIYFRDRVGQWYQQDSHHSYADGSLNPHNTKTDTRVDRVLIGADYMYWGDSGPAIPLAFRNYNGADICAKGRHHRSIFPKGLASAFVTWLRSLNADGYLGRSGDWVKTS